MDNELVIRGRTTPCSARVTRALYQSLINFTENRKLSEGHTPIILSFLQWERDLIHRVARSCLSPEEIQNAYTNQKSFMPITIFLFFQWSWTSDVFRQILTDLDPDEVARQQNGTARQGWEMCLSMIRNAKNADFFDHRHHRTTSFAMDNANFVAKSLGRNDAIIDVDKISPLPAEHDESTWLLLAALVVKNYEEALNWPGFSVIEDYQLLGKAQKEALSKPADNHQAKDHVENGGNESTLRDYLATGNKDKSEEDEDEDFLDASSVSDSVEENGARLDGQLADEFNLEGSSEREKILKLNLQLKVDGLLELEKIWDVWRVCRMFWLLKHRPANTENMKAVLESNIFQDAWKQVIVEGENEDEIWTAYFTRQPFEGKLLNSTFDFFEENFIQHLTLEYRRHKHEQALIDPSYYLHFVPFIELAPMTDDEVVRDVYLELVLERPMPDPFTYVRWKSNLACDGAYGLYISEDLYSNHITEPWKLPGTTYDGFTVFRCRPLQETVLCQQVRKFWELWNDALITKDPSGTLLLLETIPGIKARQLRSTYGHRAMETFFAFLLERKSAPVHSQQVSLLQELLGDSYDPRFNHSLRYIDPSDLTLILPDKIGEGSFGRVYRAEWKAKPVRHGAVDRTAPGPVALKVVYGGSNWIELDQAKFFDELQLAHTALTGAPTGFTDFFGFTRVSVDGRGQAHPFGSSVGVSTFALVFNFANEGMLLDHLKRHLRNGQYRDNWKTLVSNLSSIAAGLAAIHKQNILHRDLHPGNVLVESEYFANSDSVQYNCNISDIGEGKSIDQTLQHGLGGSAHSLGLVDYRAPEVLVRGSSKASDVYAFGQLCIDMIRNNIDSLIEKPGNPIRIPSKLVEILDDLVDPDPEERWPASVLGMMLDEVVDSIDDEKNEWVENPVLASFAHKGAAVSLSPFLRS